MMIEMYGNPHEERDLATARAEAAELQLSQERFMRQDAEAECEHLRKLYTHQHGIAQETLTRALAAEQNARMMTEKLAAAEAEVARLRQALRLASRYVAKAHADGAYANTAMSGERALRIIGEAMGDD